MVRPCPNWPGRMTACFGRYDPARALVPRTMPAQGTPLANILAHSGCAHCDAAAWAIPLHADGTQLVQDGLYP